MSDTGELIQNHEAVLRMITGFWVSQIVRSAADLSLAEHLADGPRSADEVAAEERADPSAVFRLMRACVSIGLLSRQGDRFAGTSLLTTLHADAPNSLKRFALSQTAPGLWLSIGRTSESVRLGASQATLALGQPLFDYFTNNPDEGALFSASMTDLSTPVIMATVPVLDVTDVRTVVDIGGASGTFVLALMARNHHLHGSVLDLAHAIPGAEKEAERHGLADRFTGVAGDFFEAVPNADLYLLKFILHDWDDDSCVRILRRCREAMNPGARIAVVDMVVDEQAAGFEPLMDIAMLATLGGKERTIAELDELFAQADLRRSKVTDVQLPYRLIEAVAS